MVHRHWSLRTTWTAYDGGSQSRLGIHDGTVSCLRSGWLVAASNLSPQGKPWSFLRYVLGCVFVVVASRRGPAGYRPFPAFFVTWRTWRIFDYARDGKVEDSRSLLPKNESSLFGKVSTCDDKFLHFVECQWETSGCMKDTSSRLQQDPRARTLKTVTYWRSTSG